MTTTARFGFTEPSDQTLVKDGAANIRALMEILEATGARIDHGTAAARPTVGIADRFYRATDTSAISLDTGTGWITVYEPLPAWTTVTLNSPLAARSGYYPPSMRIVNGHVQLRGNFTAPSGYAGAAAFTLPSADFIPAELVDIPVANNSNASWALLNVRPPTTVGGITTPAVAVLTLPSTLNQLGAFGLDGLSYPLT